MRRGRVRSRQYGSFGTNQPGRYEALIRSLCTELMRDWSESKMQGFLRYMLDNGIKQYNAFLEERKIHFHQTLLEHGINLPRGRVDKPYKYSFHLPTGFEKLRVSGYEDSGLELQQDAEEIRLHGIPSASGDYIIEFVMPSDNGELLRAELPLGIDKRPQDLWKSIDTPTGIEYYKPDARVELLACPNGKKVALGDSVRGRTHAHQGKPRDDDFAISNVGDGWCVAVVADGAGSAEFSREGSRIACDGVVRFCEEKLKDPWLEKLVLKTKPERSKELPDELNKAIRDFMRNCAHRAHAAVDECAQKANRNISKYATTLLFTLFKEIEGVGWFIVSYCVGDGAVALYEEDANGVPAVGLLMQPDGGDYAGQTHFLTEYDQLHDGRVRVAVRSEFKALLLMTDGVSDPRFETEAKLRDASLWKSLYDELRDQVFSKKSESECTSSLLQWLPFRSEGNHDDRTLLVVY